jgi:hypothetical protein
LAIASRLRPRRRRRRCLVGRRTIIIGHIREVPLASGVGGEQTLNVGKTDEIA